MSHMLPASGLGSNCAREEADIEVSQLPASTAESMVSRTEAGTSFMQDAGAKVLGRFAYAHSRVGFNLEPAKGAGLRVWVDPA